MNHGNSLSTAGVTKLAAMLIVGVILIAAVLAPMLNDLTRETIVEDYNNPDDASWIRMNYGTENIDTEYSVAGDTLTIGDQSGAAQDMILYADEKSCVMYSDGFTIVNGYSDPATVVKADTVHITNADGTLTISDGTDIIIQTSSPAWAYYPDKEGIYGYFSADVDGVKVKDGNQAMTGNFAGVYTYNNLIIGPDNIGDMGMSMDADIQDGVIQTITWAKGVTDADSDSDPDDALTTAQVSGGSNVPNMGSANPSNGTRIGDLYYIFSGTNATVIGYASTIDWTTFTSIPNTVENNGVTYTVTNIDQRAFYNCTNLALTSLPSGLTRIGTDAFYGCTNLALTSLPNGLVYINESAFQNCTNLALTSLPDSVTTIGKKAFSECINLQLTSLPSSLVVIRENTFFDCKNLRLTSLPSGLTSIESNAFYYCTNLALTSLPSGLTKVGDNALRECKYIQMTSLPNNLTNIGGAAFNGCTRLALTSLPSGLTSISNSVFGECPNLALTSLPDGVTSIGGFAFQRCTNLALTSLPSGLTSLGASAFADCPNLALTSLPDGLTSIGQSTFTRCTSLALTSLPSGLTSISSNAFSGCTNLKSLIVQSSPTISSNAFIDCTNLKQILNLGDLDIVTGSTTNGSIALYADEVRSDIPAMGYVAPLSYTKIVQKEGTAYDILLMMPVLLVIALLIPIANYFVGDKVRSRIR